ncbi:glycosyltransferase [Pedobacter flavus]|uniref:Glycosyltransferase n=1 Tax=Pedobacter flavus TaxID=3113906 RepID=A0ABU7H059_9SPHI|nr:glycosyltransferase [Pedobacter sp. VNH31]MEE1884705.1 glycosyltransferase [Pedobacter sp. VNH31]
MSKARICLGFHEIAGYYYNLQEGMRDLGYKADFFTVNQHAFKYRKNSNRNVLLSCIRELGKFKTKIYGNTRFSRRMYVILSGLYSILVKLLFYYCLKKYDVFIFGVNSSFKDLFDYEDSNRLTFNDLEKLKKHNKKIIYIYHGSDARPPYMDGFTMSTTSGTVKECYDLTKAIKTKVEEVEKYADYIINAPATSQFHRVPIIDFIKIGVPFATSNISREPLLKQSSEIIILHSPSNPIAKGSPEIIRVVEKLIKQGYKIKLDLVSNQPNSVVLEKLRKADIVVDQLYSDTPMAGFATEAAHFGKPVIVCGYYSEIYKEYLPKQLVPPTFFVHPDKLEETIIQLLERKELREESGMAVKKFVKEQWGLENVAKKFERIINDDVPEDWYIDPFKIKYWQGCCIKDSNALKLMQDMLDAYGVESLQLQDKPILLNEILSKLKK